MKVIVIDDNVAIQEILKDILIENGHIVKISGNISNAVNQIIDFRPDAILLDAKVNDEDGMQILTRAHEMDRDLDLATILVKGVNDEVPHDSPYIKATVNKPFKSSDISNALETLMKKKEEERLEREGAKKKKFGGLFGSKKKPESEEQIADDTKVIEEHSNNEGPLFGNSYVFFEREPNKIYDFLKIFSPQDYSIQIISSDNAKAVRQRLGSDIFDITTLSAGGRGKTMDINALGTLTVFIKEYIHEHDNPIIVIDNFSNIIDSNGLNHSLVFIHQLINSKDSEKTVSFLVSVNQSALTIKDRNILLGDMSEYSN